MAPPGGPEERWRRWALTLGAPPVVLFSSPQIRYWLLLAASSADEPGISSAERRRPVLHPPSGGTGLVPDLPEGLCAAASRFQLLVSRGVAVLIAGGISRFSSAPRVSHLSPCRRCEGALGRTRRHGCRITKSPSPRAVNPSCQDAPPPPRPAPLSRGISVWLLCSGAF